ncbi:hypothetical protein B9Z19DRAFT_770029 [Tuber borchii]|uniref:Uncharacterized protein n=1 Tax=Tuber borchii TaxID=42251 RepID=A0A2T6ZX00_TUBBO|nr:hypothetical protein B9Z19DRAFT_770029 [Tuber borchii]
MRAQGESSGWWVGKPRSRAVASLEMRKRDVASFEDSGDSVRNGAVRPSWARTRTDDISSSRPVFLSTCPTSENVGRGRTALCHPPPSPTVPCRPPPSSVVFRCFLSSPAVPYLKFSRPWGLSSLLMTAVLGAQGRGRTTFCSPVSSGGLGSPPTGPYGGPGRLRTLSGGATLLYMRGPGAPGPPPSNPPHPLPNWQRVVPTQH